MAENSIKKYLDAQGVTTLWTRIKTELDNRDSVLDAAIKAETTRATGIEQGLATDISEENKRAVAAEKALEGKITTAKETADAANQLATEVKTSVGTVPEGSTDVIAYINKKTEGIASDEALTSLTQKVTAAESDIDAIQADYLKTADKAELTTAIEAAQTDATKANTDLAAEITRAKEAEKANADAITLLTNGAGTEKIDSVNELIKYVETHGTEVTGMQKGISDNKAAIETLNGDVSKDGSVANKIKAQADTDAKVYATKTDMANADKGLSDRIDTLETKDHEHKNLTLLETYTQTETNLADAVAKKHSHTNMSELNTITQIKINAWDAAEANAKTYANDEVYAKIVSLSTQDIDDAIAAVSPKPAARMR